MSAMPRLLALLTACILTACAAPALQVAGMGKTGYDVAVLVDEHAPKGRVDFNSNYGCIDETLQRRIRERLRMNGYLGLTVHVYNAHGYLTGPAPDRGWADSAIRIASSVQGLKRLTCRFFPPSENTIQDRDRTRRLQSALKPISSAKGQRVHGNVFGGTAVVTGLVRSEEDKRAALGKAHDIAGITDVVDYVRVAMPDDPDPEDSASDAETVAK